MRVITGERGEMFEINGSEKLLEVRKVAEG